MISVIDSSVAVKWYAVEPDSFIARRLLARSIVAPDLIRTEVANSLRKKIRAGEMRVEQALQALPHLARSVRLLPTEPFAEMALELALELGHPVYDCVFLEIARTLDFPFVTADMKLWKRTRNTSFGDRVILLRDWEPDDER